MHIYGDWHIHGHRPLEIIKTWVPKDKDFVAHAQSLGPVAEHPATQKWKFLFLTINRKEIESDITQPAVQMSVKLARQMVPKPGKNWEAVLPQAPFDGVRLLAQRSLAILYVKYPRILKEIIRAGSFPSEQLGNVRYNIRIITYYVYKKAQSYAPQPLTKQQQHGLVDGLIELESANGRIRISVQDEISTDACTLANAFKHGHAYTYKGNYLVRAQNDSQRATKDPETQVCARLTLNVKPSEVLRIATHAANLLHGKFESLLNSIKVIGASKQGLRCDSVILYLQQADPQKAKELADHLASELGDGLLDSTPLGMERMQPGISYGECPSKTSTDSFGEAIAVPVADALVDHLANGLTLDGALVRELGKHGFSPDMPSRAARR